MRNTDNLSTGGQMPITVPKSFGTGDMQNLAEEQEQLRLMRRWVFKHA